MQQDLAWRRIARRVFVSDAEIQIAQRNPHGFAAPADLKELVPERQQSAECGHGQRRRGIEMPDELHTGRDDAQSLRQRMGGWRGHLT